MRQRIKLYNAGLIDAEIAKRCNVTPQTIWSWRKRHKLPKNRKNQVQTDSLCFDCRNGYTGKCAWIGKMEKVWDEAEVRIAYNNNRACKIYTVIRCQKFQKEEAD